jgi:hypothetical protein
MEQTSGQERSIGWCLHALGTLLILAPLIDLGAGLWFVPAEGVPWRFGASGLLSGAMVLPALGFGLLMLATVLLEQLTMTRVLSVLALLLFLTIIGVTILFGLDALQVRAGVLQAEKPRFDLATMKAMATFGIEALVFVTLAFHGWRLGRLAGPTRGARRSTPLVVGKADS